MSPVKPIDEQDEVERFVLGLLRTGVMLSDLCEELVEALPADAYPGEDNGDVVLEMLVGSIRGAMGETPPDQLDGAAKIIDCAADGVIEHLTLALELRRRTDAGRRGLG